jgi:hypothetical protein
MGAVHIGDDDLHYSDSSHRWIAPPEIAQEQWEVRLRAHMDQHLLTMGRPANLEHFREYRSPHVPHPHPVTLRAGVHRTATRSCPT